MKILNLNENENLVDWGIKRTSKQKGITWKQGLQNYDVFRIPVDILVYNSTNGRMFMEAKKFESEQNVSLDELKVSDPERYNDEVENLIWSTNEERNNYTKKEIEKFGQLEPGVVLDDGTVIDGNRRFTCLRRLHREHPTDERFAYFDAALIKVDGKKITHKILKEYELKVQFGADEKVGYNVINMNMSIYDLIEKSDTKDFDYTSVAELVNKTPGEIAKICKTCELVDEFLEYIKKPGEYKIAEEMKIYWPLEPLVTYFDNEGKNLTEIEKLERKHLFFDYLLTLNVSLITQNLRDGLIKKVFKDADETKELIKEHKETIGDKIHEVIEKSEDTDELVSSINKLKNTNEANDDQDHYEKKVHKQVAKNQMDIPLKECQAALKSLNNVNVKPLINASNTIAQKKLAEVRAELDKVIKKANEIIAEIK
ncbi:MAG: hypothetical protein MJ211_13970 [Bacteroidales bacterium]|nr:hypothetical protein [Bacteroidales bacterium]